MRGEMVPDMGREGHLYRAIFNREGQLRERFPGSNIRLYIDDDYPRGTITVEGEEGKLRKEFFESAASLDSLPVEDEYLESLEETGSLAVHLPSMSFTGTRVVELVTDLHIKAREKGIKEEVQIDGFLFDFEGNEEQVA